MKTGKKEHLFKLVIIGDASTGKSSLLRRYCENDFSETYVCTIGVDFQLKILKMNDQQIVKLQIWDTAGQERFKVMTKSYYRSAKACLIVYDITRKETFENVKVWCEQYMQNNSGGARSKQNIVILGNKRDLTEQRQVEFEAGEKLAEEIGCQFFEVSAKVDGDEISRIFFSLAEILLQNEDGITSGAKKGEEERNSVVLRAELAKKKKNCC